MNDELTKKLIDALRDARAALDNVGLIDTHIDFDAVEKAKKQADAVLLEAARS
jgi:hypothetical protein